MEKFFGISISPEKEIVMILISNDIKEAVLKAINKAAGLETKGQGIAFCLPVSDVVGL
jgi:nitrogen regulatory protein PII